MNEGLYEIEKRHISRGFGAFYWWRVYHIGYHYVICANGEIVGTRPEHLRGAHAKGANDMIGICILGDFDSSAGNMLPTRSQMKSAEALCRALLKKYRIESHLIFRHSDIDDYTVCPGDHFPFDQLVGAIRERT